MENSKQIFSDEKRIVASKGVYVQIASLKVDHSYFNVFDPKDQTKIKYMGKITNKQDHSEYCTCPDNFHRNTEDYKNTHALAFQCKHQIAYREYLRLFRIACQELENDKN